MAAIQQNKLTQVVALKETNARLRGEVDQLKAENVKLSTHVSSLESSVTHLQELSHTLDVVRAMEGQSLDELEKQVAESEQILDKMQDNLRGAIVQTLISMVLAIDHDGDMCLSDAEIDSLILKVEEMSADHFDFKDQLLRQKLIENGRSLNAVMDIIKDLMDDDAKPEDSIFAFINNPKVESTTSAQLIPTVEVPPEEAADAVEVSLEDTIAAVEVPPEETAAAAEPLAVITAEVTPPESDPTVTVDLAAEEPAAELISTESGPSEKIESATEEPTAELLATEDDQSVEVQLSMEEHPGETVASVEVTASEEVPTAADATAPE